MKKYEAIAWYHELLMVLDYLKVHIPCLTTIVPFHCKNMCLTINKILQQHRTVQRSKQSVW